MTPRRATALLAAAAVLLAPAAARADGDPASDVLLVQDAYLPVLPGAREGARPDADAAADPGPARGLPDEGRADPVGRRPRRLPGAAGQARGLRQAARERDRLPRQAPAPAGRDARGLRRPQPRAQGRRGARRDRHRHRRAVRRAGPRGARGGRRDRHRQRSSHAGPRGQGRGPPGRRRRVAHRAVRDRGRSSCCSGSRSSRCRCAHASTSRASSTTTTTEPPPASSAAKAASRIRVGLDGGCGSFIPGPCRGGGSGRTAVRAA